MKDETFITTKDNPYDYWLQFDEWLSYDHLMGYNTLELLARLIRTSDDLSEQDQEDEFRRAFCTMMRYNPNYVPVQKPANADKVIYGE